MADTIALIKNGRIIEELEMVQLKEENVDLEAHFMSFFQEKEVDDFSY